MQYRRLYVNGKIYTAKEYADSDTVFKRNNSLINLENDDGTCEILDILEVDYGCQCGLQGPRALARGKKEKKRNKEIKLILIA